ncbi:2-C-methyl-D-erythritol 4-phosphate cytidylyltransferase [Marininema mesophilum]|uniref:2-C-methyl-D-erythritol 4-phosphate cytidylyltransferase n=1 Tax=Marininema mesophilum TaxID=1048340 RepID=A0A1H2PZR2_9BACL|nr:IspD/TarI family cytidylyltransferase [Marininema mesophilum]SDW00376.1 2-C-methyl-D-erythritol 4-phosphate cytidylyltransferase [Marininema mesophilum]
MKRLSMILLSGGIGTRMKATVPKQFLPIGGKPMIVHVLEKIDQMNAVDEIIIPSPQAHIERTEELIRTHQFSKRIQVIEGGATRQQSVMKGLANVSHPSVLIHEAVRPLVRKEEFERLIQSEAINATYGTDIPFTVLEGEAWIEKTLDRNRLINIQLPQKFDTAKLSEAHQKAAKEQRGFTEDASLFFHYHKENIAVLEGTEYNIKITKPIDQQIGEIIYKDYILGGV